MIRLIYASASTHPMRQPELEELLSGSRRRNAAAGISGMLVYRDGSFLQVLEGSEEAIDALYAKVLADPRHGRVLLLQRVTVDERGFGDWAMGFVHADRVSSSDLPGFHDFFGDDVGVSVSTRDAERARDLLYGFRDGRWRRFVDAGDGSAA